MKQDRNRRDAFSQKMVDILNYGALNLAMGIGYRLELFEVLDSFEVPQPLSSIAKKANLNERYIREWLGVMVCGGVVEIFPGAGGEETYSLPKEYADLLTRRAGNANLGVYAQEVPLLTTCAMEGVLNGFRTGEGIGYESYPAFQAFMSELAIAKHRQVLVDKFLPTVDDGKLVGRMNDGIRVCDLGCAEGTALLLMARAFPASRFTGIDLSESVVREAQAGAADQGLTNVTFQVMDAATVKDHREWCGAFDYVTAFDAIHDQTRPFEAIQGAHHVLADGGLFSMIDIAASSRMSHNASHPMGPFLYAVSLMHCMPVGLVEGGAGLGMMWGRELAVDMLQRGGFQEVEVMEMPHDPFNLHFLCRK